MIEPVSNVSLAEKWWNEYQEEKKRIKKLFRGTKWTKKEQAQLAERAKTLPPLHINRIYPKEI